MSTEFAKMLADWNSLGNLLDIFADIDDGRIQFELTFDEYKKLSYTKTFEERKKLVGHMINKERFDLQKSKFLNSMSEKIDSVWKTDLEVWQKLLTFIYLKFRAVPKSKRLIQFKPNFAYLSGYQK